MLCDHSAADASSDHAVLLPSPPLIGEGERRPTDFTLGLDGANRIACGLGLLPFLRTGCCFPSPRLSPTEPSLTLYGIKPQCMRQYGRWAGFVVAGVTEGSVSKTDCSDAMPYTHSERELKTCDATHSARRTHTHTQSRWTTALTDRLVAEGAGLYLAIRARVRSSMPPDANAGTSVRRANGGGCHSHSPLPVDPELS
jgi:hypothetical protein